MANRQLQEQQGKIYNELGWAKDWKGKNGSALHYDPVLSLKRGSVLILDVLGIGDGLSNDQ